MRKRSLGTGRICRRKQRGAHVYVGDWKGADGKRHRKTLSSDKRVSERMLADIIRNRDLTIAGLAVEEGIDRPIHEIRTEFEADLKARRSPGYASRVSSILDRALGQMRVQVVRDLTPQAFLAYRRSRLADGIANRTANMELTTIRTMLNWAVQSNYISFTPYKASSSCRRARRTRSAHAGHCPRMRSTGS